MPSGGAKHDRSASQRAASSGAEHVGPWTRRRRVVARFALAAGLATACLGCPATEGDPAEDASDANAPETTPELRARAQTAALARLRPLTVAALRLDDPAFASRWSDAPPSLPPLGAAAREALRVALAPARDEARGLRPQTLSPQDRAVALVARFGLDRSNDRVFRRRPTRTDPDWILLELDHLLDVLSVRAQRRGACTACADALARVPESLQRAREDLGATSAEAQLAATTHASELADRVAALPLDAAALTPTRDALAAYGRWLETIEFPDAANAQHTDAIVPASGPTAVLRLPARLGAAALSRRLEVEENLSASPAELFTALGPSVSQLGKLRNATPIDDVEPASPLTMTRCKEAWAPLAAFAAKTPVVSAGDFTCAHFVEGWGEGLIDPTALGLALIDVALIETHRAAQLDATAEVIRATPGRVAQASQQHTMRTAIALGSGHPAAAEAIAREHDAACLAATAVWIHGEVGDDEALAKRLTTHCPAKDPQAWIAAAEGRPRAALRGLGLARVSDGPAGLVSLDRYWWAPLGFVDLLADPGQPGPVGKATVNLEVEPVQSGESTPAAPAKVGDAP